MQQLYGLLFTVTYTLLTVCLCALFVSTIYLDCDDRCDKTNGRYIQGSSNLGCWSQHKIVKKDTCVMMLTTTTTTTDVYVDESWNLYKAEQQTDARTRRLYFD